MPAIGESASRKLTEASFYFTGGVVGRAKVREVWTGASRHNRCHLWREARSPKGARLTRAPKVTEPRKPLGPIEFLGEPPLQLARKSGIVITGVTRVWVTAEFDQSCDATVAMCDRPADALPASVVRELLISIGELGGNSRPIHLEH